MNMFKQTSLLATVAVIGFSPLALAESFGYVEGTLEYGDGANPNDNEAYQSFGGAVKGVFGHTFNSGGSIVADALVHFDSYDEDLTDNEESLPQYQASLHYLHPLNGALTLGGFAGYGIAPYEDSDERYQVGFLGATAVYDLNAAFSLFGQVGYGTSFDPDEMDSAGFYNGYVIRSGAIYTGLDFATLRAEVEFAGTEEYEDSAEPGEMWTVALMGESEIASVNNLAVTYGVRYGYYSAPPDDDFIEETTVTLGVRYMFGGATPAKMADIGYVGSPYLPLRGSYWTPAMD